MTTAAAMPASAKKPQNVQKEDAMWLQKELIAGTTWSSRPRARRTARSSAPSCRAT